MGPVGDVSAGDSHHLPEILFTWVTGAFFSVPFGFVGCFILVVLGPDREEFGISGFSKASLYIPGVRIKIRAAELIVRKLQKDAGKMYNMSDL
jgi:hypothetical protein